MSKEFIEIKTFGAEIEKPISNIETGEPAGVTQKFFKKVASKFPEAVLPKDETVIKVSSTKGKFPRNIALDNGFNLQETASEVVPSLTSIENVIKDDLKIIQDSLVDDKQTVINMSNHPLAKTDMEFYKKFVAPKSIYEIIWQRGWDHAAGIDAKAHNSPGTGVEPKNAAKAVSTIVGAGAMMIGLFGNSPFNEGELSKFKETRSSMWERFMKNSISEGDRKNSRFPEKPFKTLKEYINWMFGEGTSMLFVIPAGADYKYENHPIMIDGNPGALQFLKMRTANGYYFKTNESVQVVPELSHMADMQFMQFLGARIRWEFDKNKIAGQLDNFFEAYGKDNLEDFFDKTIDENSMRIEGRDSGANFPDSYLKSLGDDLAWSAVTSPSAIQAGLIANLAEASKYIESFEWLQLKGLRESAIKDGLQGSFDGISVYKFTSELLAIASKGLESKHHHMLLYPEHVLKTKQNGADRALDDYFNKGKSIKDIVKSRNVSV